MAGVRNGPGWGLRPVLVPVMVFVLVIAGGMLLVAAIHPTTATGRLTVAVAVTLVGEGLLAAGVWAGGRGVARRHGGWAVFGWARPRLVDLGVAGIGFVVALTARAVVGVVAAVATHGKATAQAANLRLLHHPSWAVVALLAVVLVGCAPVLEELTFRGLLLRSFLRRMPFLPATALSTVIFALFHTYEAASALGAVTLAVSVACLGATNCVLVRYTDRLAAGIGVHAALNALALLVAVTTTPA